MNNIIKFFSLLLVAAVVLAAVYSCASEQQGAEQTDVAADDTAAPEPETTDKYGDNLPETMDLGGYEYRFLGYEEYNINSDYTLYLMPDEMDGDILNDTAYKRNSEIEERLNVKLTFVPCQDHYAGELIVKTVMAGEDAYDSAILWTSLESGIKLLKNNCLYNILNLPYINPESEYYFPTMTGMYNINNKLYCIGSYFTNSGIMPIQIIFNSSYITDMGMELPYDIVFSDSWTIDVLNEYIKDAYFDLNGNGVKDYGDKVGYYNHEALTNYMISGLDINTVTKTEDGRYAPLISGEKLVNAIQKLMEFKNGETVREIKSYEKTHVFMDGNAMFTTTGTGALDLRAIEAFDFGIAPYPKYDENQERYCCYAVLSPVWVPSTIQNPEAVGAVTEALAAASYKQMNPVYIDIYIEQKILRDENSVKCLKLMQENVVSDFLRVMDFTGGLMKDYDYVNKICKKGPDQIVSSLAAIETKVTVLAEEFFRYFD
ncbi:MAG: hypothetical protein GX897_01380 [Clostridiales bacterium]|nr:hypothetical protein [Clostridiales bacterium]